MLASPLLGPELRDQPLRARQRKALTGMPRAVVWTALGGSFVLTLASPWSSENRHEAHVEEAQSVELPPVDQSRDREADPSCLASAEAGHVWMRTGIVSDAGESDRRELEATWSGGTTTVVVAQDAGLFDIRHHPMRIRTFRMWMNNLGNILNEPAVPTGNPPATGILGNTVRVYAHVTWRCEGVGSGSYRSESVDLGDALGGAKVTIYLGDLPPQEHPRFFLQEAEVAVFMRQIEASWGSR